MQRYFETVEIWFLLIISPSTFIISLMILAWIKLLPWWLPSDDVLMLSFIHHRKIQQNKQMREKSKLLVLVRACPRFGLWWFYISLMCSHSSLSTFWLPGTTRFPEFILYIICFRLRVNNFFLETLIPFKGERCEIICGGCEYCPWVFILSIYLLYIMCNIQRWIYISHRYQAGRIHNIYVREILQMFHMYIKYI